jgi:hypothetical protein
MDEKTTSLLVAGVAGAARESHASAGKNEYGTSKPTRGPPPDSHARNHDPPLYHPDRAPDRDTSRAAVQAVAYLLSLYGWVPVSLENDALAFLEFRDALAEASPFRSAFGLH